MEARMTPANELGNNKRFLAGLMFLAIGAVAIWMAQDYPIGSALRMGPGYFPIVLSGIMVLFGIYELVLGIMKSDPVKGNWSIRALIVLPLAAVLFGILMEHGGFIPALVVLVFASAASSNEFKFMEVLISAVVLTIGSVGLFIYGLGLPYPLFSLSGM
jgi:putative tricarboxylic transport membrane protein